MKKLVILFLMFVGGLCALSGQQAEKQKVAVYITDGSEMNIGSFAGDFLVNAIVKRGQYLAVERTADFLGELRKEQGYQTSGNVDDNQLSQLGKQFGVQLVCVVKVNKMGSGHFMSARLIDVETATLVSTARPLKFADIDGVEEVCEGITTSMFGERGSRGSMSQGRGQTVNQVTRTHPGEPEMVEVQGGTFVMGSSSGDDEKPLHRVTVSDFKIGKYEITQAQWRAVMGTSVREQMQLAGQSNLYGEGDNNPIYYVSWNEVQEFCDRLNAATGKNYRLPTEAEWEYAAKGGNQSRAYTYSGSNSPYGVAWYTDNSGSTTHPVGTKLPNELGIYDMSGNVWEWCSDWYGSYDSSSQTDPTGAVSGSFRVNRGGSWNHDATRCRVANRDRNSPGDRYIILGFRLVLP